MLPDHRHLCRARKIAALISLLALASCATGQQPERPDGSERSWALQRWTDCYDTELQAPTMPDGFADGVISGFRHCQQELYRLLSLYPVVEHRPIASQLVDHAIREALDMELALKNNLREFDLQFREQTIRAELTRSLIDDWELWF